MMLWAMTTVASMSALPSDVAAATWTVDGNYGDDSNDGGPNTPWRTLARAQIAIREWRSAWENSESPPKAPRVMLRAGVYPPLHLGPEDSGLSPTDPVVWAAQSRETAVLSAGFTIPPERLAEVPNPLRPSGPTVLHVNLGQFNLTTAQFGQLHGASDSSISGCWAPGKMDVYSNGAPLLLARHPNPFRNGTWRWMYVNGTAGPPSKHPGPPASASQFVWRPTDTAEVGGWESEDDPWVQGYFQFDWTDTIARISALIPGNRTVALDPSTPTYGGGLPIRSGARWLGLNLLSELDSPGEFYIDRVKGDLYLIPAMIDGVAPSPPSVVVSVNRTVLNATNASNLRFEGLKFMYAQGTGVVLSGSNLTLSNCTVANHGTMGVAAVGVGNTIEGTTVRDTGCAGITITAGDRRTLIPGRSRVVGNTIHNFGGYKRMYQPGISFDAVGSTFAHNTIHSAPHSGMLGHANDCTFEENNFTELCTESGDAGAWYSGRSWADRGNQIVNNRFERIRNFGPPIPLQGQNVNAIHFDDQMSGYLVAGNTIVDCWEGVRLGGGRRVTITNNTFIKVDIPVAFDNRGMTWQKLSCTPPNGSLFHELAEDRVDSPPYAFAYPYLQHIAQEYPCVPVYNNISNNRFCLCGSWITASAADIATWHSVAFANTNYSNCIVDSTQTT
eukprot:m.207927 g.207927  ORF g.207927 m.207927 type:complete len:671 (-) comp15446_c1_seq26:3200-5212(-)